MLYTIAVVLIILWLLGLVTSYTVGGFIHILLVVAVIMQQRPVVAGSDVREDRLERRHELELRHRLEQQQHDA